MNKRAEKFLKNDKYIGPLIKKYGPCKLKKKSSLRYFEALLRAIVGQQLSVKVASTIYARFEELVGKNPTPEVVLKLTIPQMRKVGLSKQKSSYIKDLAKNIKTGKLEIERLDDLTDEKVMEELTTVKGIGNWTAEMFLMFTLKRPDIFPVDDLGIRKGMVKLKPSFARATAGELEKFAEKNWAPFRTFASWYIWENLDNK